MAVHLSYISDGHGGLTFRLAPTPGSPGITTALPLSHSEACVTAVSILHAAGVTDAAIKDGRLYEGNEH